MARHLDTRAALLHLLASLLVVGGAVAGLLSLWYPPALWDKAGIGRPLLTLLVAVVLAGPLLTAVVYRIGKPGLWMDMAVVLLIQLLFLGYALHMLGRERPVFLVGTPGGFELVLARDIDREDLALARQAGLAPLSWTGPRPVGLRPRTGNDLLAAVLGGDDAAHRQPTLYLDYASAGPAVGASARPLSELDGAPRARLEEAARKAGHQRENARWLPWHSRHGAGAALLDSATGQPIVLLPAAVLEPSESR